jgi:hypothetical protein
MAEMPSGPGIELIVAVLIALFVLILAGLWAVLRDRR